MILYTDLADLYQSAFGHTTTLLEVCKQSLRLAEQLQEWGFAAAMSYRAGDCAWCLSMYTPAPEPGEKALHSEAVVLQQKARQYAERAGDRLIEADACERLGFLHEEDDPELSRRMFARYHSLTSGEEASGKPGDNNRV